MKEELVKQMDIDLQRVSDYDIELNEFAGWEACPHVNIHYDTMAKELIDMGWTKQIWHKVADEDLPDEGKACRIVLEWLNVKYYATGSYLHSYGWVVDGNPNSNARVIAWTELPTYKED